MSVAELPIQILLRRQEATHFHSFERGLGQAQDSGRAEKGDLDLQPSPLEQMDGLIQIIETLRIGANITVHHHLDRTLLQRLGGCLRSVSREGEQLGIATYPQDIVQQRLTHAKYTLRPIHQFPQRSDGDVAIQYIPEIKHEGK